jgi:hypothetical protein
MTDKRFKTGVGVSVLWLLVVIGLLFVKRADLPSMQPNAWGDLFAGCFAPLAFLWLVLGYLQQGEELRLSTAALKLQAEELKNSVEQQRALVEVSRQQVEGERQKLAEDRRISVAAARPKILVESGDGSFRGDGRSTYPLVFSNAGDTACQIEAEFRHSLGMTSVLYKAPAFERGEIRHSSIDVERPELVEESALSVRYKDRLGNEYTDKYLVTRQSENPQSHLRISRIEA